MQAAVRDRYGPPDVVSVHHVDRPVPTADQVLVRTQAASVNRADLDALYPRPAFSRLFLGIRAPRLHRVGCDIAGIVEAAGDDVTRFRPGDRVFADLYPYGQGSFAEFVNAREMAFQPIPPDLSFEDAATLPHSAVLAIQSLRLRDGRAVGRGAKVLIDGASGNVGPFAVQIAKALGAEVTGVASAAKLDFVRSLGADHVLDYRAVDYTTTGERYDWIVDTDSHHTITRIRHALRPNGVYVTLGGTGSRIVQSMIVGPVMRLAAGKRMGLLLWWKPFKSEDVTALTDLIGAGKLKPVIDRSFPLAQVVDALRFVDAGHARGKVIVTP